MSVSFSLKLDINPFRIINSNSRIMLIGSCFTENIGNFLLNSGFNTLINPFGIIYNPVSISNSLNYIIDKKQFCEADLFLTHENRYISFDHHGRFSGYEISKVLDEINIEIDKAHLFLKNADCLIVTLGSAWAYRYNKNNNIVANCHKVPNNEFTKEMLSINTICEKLISTIKKIKNFNKNISLIFTISPVKHYADGIVENQQSKAALILSVKQIIENFNNGNYYFPAYEIVNDELRDYRFYENDHAHPTSQAIEYVWQRFTETCFTDDANNKIKEAVNVSKIINHRHISTANNLNPDIFKRIKLFLEKYNKE